MSTRKIWDAAIVGGGVAGLSAAIYLGRALRQAVVISQGNSMAVWEPEVRNFLGFPDGVSGEDLLKNARRQAADAGATFAEERIESVTGQDGCFLLSGQRHTYEARKVLLATGIFHLPPEIEGVRECLGHSMFFCKDCDGMRVRGRRVAVCGHNDEAVEYALALLAYSPRVLIALHGKKPVWSRRHEGWVREYEIPVCPEKIQQACHDECQLQSLLFAGGERVAVDALFTTRGDIIFNDLAKAIGAKIARDGGIEIDHCQMTSIPGLYAAGCVTPANCQMIIAAGQGAIAAQAINRALFEESLATHNLCRFRQRQLDGADTAPDVIETKS